MGGHVRVGLEDNNKTPDGKVATNYELVKHVVEMAKAMGREIATPEELSPGAVPGASPAEAALSSANPPLT